MFVHRVYRRFAPIKRANEAKNGIPIKSGVKQKTKKRERENDPNNSRSRSIKTLPVQFRGQWLGQSNGSRRKIHSFDIRHLDRLISLFCFQRAAISRCCQLSRFDLPAPAIDHWNPCGTMMHSCLSIDLLGGRWKEQCQAPLVYFNFIIKYNNAMQHLPHTEYSFRYCTV